MSKERLGNYAHFRYAMPFILFCFVLKSIYCTFLSHKVKLIRLFGHIQHRFYYVALTITSIDLKAKYSDLNFLALNSLVYHYAVWWKQIQSVQGHSINGIQNVKNNSVLRCSAVSNASQDMTLIIMTSSQTVRYSDPQLLTEGVC